MKLGVKRTENNEISISSKDGVLISKDIILPNHVALICDGNRRWARARGLSIVEGHKRGGEVIGNIARCCRKFGIHTFTAWIFSTENWSRGEKEAKELLKLIERAFGQHIDEAKKNNVRIIHLGRKDRIPQSLARKLARAEEETRSNKSYVFNIAIDYGGHDEIVRATRKIIEDGIGSESINEKLFASYLDTRDQPYPNVDLLIRTSGEQRLSRFLPWQTADAEAWWEESCLPDFSEERFVEILLDYSRRRRRFGGSDSVRKFNFRPRVVARLELDWWRAKKFKEHGGFTRAFAHYIKEQFGISLSLARQATEIFVKAAILGEEEKDWTRAKKLFTRFYRFLKQNVKLAFEPSLVANLEVEYLKKTNGERKIFEIQAVASRLIAEIFRIPLLQANKAGYLKVLAKRQQDEAEGTTGKTREALLKRAEDYLIRSYEALKERVV